MSTLRQIADQLSDPTPIMEAAGKAVEVGLKRHFKERQAEGNKQGFPDLNFWFGLGNSVAAKTQLTHADADGATVTIASRPFALKLYGGTITPKRAKALAIPLTAEAYSKSGQGTLRESFPNLILIKREGKNPILATVAGDQVTAHFVLVKSTTHRPDPRALPPAETLQSTATAAAQKALGLILTRRR